MTTTTIIGTALVALVVLYMVVDGVNDSRRFNRRIELLANILYWRNVGLRMSRELERDCAQIPSLCADYAYDNLECPFPAGGVIRL